MRKLILGLCLLLSGTGIPIFAQEGELGGGEISYEATNKFFTGEVVEIIKEGQDDIFGDQWLYQEIRVRLLDGDEAGKIVDIKPGGMSIITEEQKVKVGDKVVVSKTELVDREDYFVIDKYRLPSLGILLALFIGVTIFFSQWKGFSSLLGLLFSVLVLWLYVIPQILAGKDAVLVCFIGGLVIAFFSIYLSHGFNRRTSIALLSTFITLVLAFGISVWFVHLSKLFGVGTEESFYLQLDLVQKLDLRGLLLGSIVIGTIGILDDVTTTQCATVDELLKANKNFNLKELYARGISVGKEHIASMVNTLALAYAGAALPMFLLTNLNDVRPWWVIVNSEFIAEEVVRTLSGSLALILAVPISTYLAAYLLKKRTQKI